MEQYLKQKFQWDNSVLTTIDWHAIEIVLNRHKPYRRTKLCQMMYNWQHDGHQKNQMYGEEGKCPMGCGANETHMHYLHCTDEGMIKY